MEPNSQAHVSRKNAWRTRLENSCRRVFHELGVQTECVMQNALSAELQSVGFTVSTEVPFAVPYTTSVGTTVTVGTVRMDVMAVSPKDDTFVLELKVSAAAKANHVPDIVVQQLAKYKPLLPASATLMLVVFAPRGVVVRTIV